MNARQSCALHPAGWHRAKMLAIILLKTYFLDEQTYLWNLCWNYYDFDISTDDRMHWIMTSCSTRQWLTWYNMQCLCHVSSFCANNSTVIALMVPLNYTCVTVYRADTCKMLIFISNTSRKLVLIGVWKASVSNYVVMFVFGYNETKPCMTSVMMTQ